VVPLVSKVFFSDNIIRSAGYLSQLVQLNDILCKKLEIFEIFEIWKMISSRSELCARFADCSRFNFGHLRFI
jgi:hypothetical protein